jgi:sec-independent protein translocase protein TatA
MFNFVKNIGLPEIILIAVILILLFGGKKIKELSRGLGESSKELKKVKKEYQEAVSEDHIEEKPEAKEEPKEESIV